MRPLFQGTWATLLLPLRADDSIHWEVLSGELALLVESGVDGVYSNGTAGEFYAQTGPEFARIQDLLASRCHKAGMPFQIGASHTSADVSLERIRLAKQWAPDAIQIILPDWRPLNSREALRFLAIAAEAACDIPLVLYHPPHSKRLLPAEEIGCLAKQLPSLRGIKVGVVDEAGVASVRTLAPHLSIFVPGHRLASGIAAGADGSYSNLACLNPSGAKRWNELIASSAARAGEIERRIQEFFDIHITPLAAKWQVAPHAIDKFLAAIGGWANIDTRMRWPNDSLPMEEALRLRPVARHDLPELF